MQELVSIRKLLHSSAPLSILYRFQQVPTPGLVPVGTLPPRSFVLSMCTHELYHVSFSVKVRKSATTELDA